MGKIWLHSCVSGLVFHLLLKCYYLSCLSLSDTLQNPCVSPLFLTKTFFVQFFSKTFCVIDVSFDFCKYLTMQVTNLHKQDMRLKPTSIFLRSMGCQPLKRPIIFWSYHLNRDEAMHRKKTHRQCEGSHILQSAEPGVYDHDSFLTFSPNDVCKRLGFQGMKSRSQFLGLWHQFDDHDLFSLSKIHDLIFLIIMWRDFMLN